MDKIIKDTIYAKGIEIGIYTTDFENEFISLTDIARYKSDDPAAVIQNWMRNRDVIEFLGLWEIMHNPDFNPLEFEGVKKASGANAFTFSIKKWNIEQNILQPQRLEMLREMALNQLRTIQSLDFSSQKILTISDKNGGI
jgi:hypothetical protein